MGVPPVNFVVRKYTWGLDLAGLNGAINSVGAADSVGGLLAMQDPNDPNDPNDTFGDFVYLYDGAGNVGQLVDWSHDPNDPNGAIVAKYEYDPYGGRISTPGEGEYVQPWRFSTKEWDDETGLGYWGYRYYSASVGRRVSRDPIEQAQRIDLYTYTLNDPVNDLDALGLLALWQETQPSTQPAAYNYTNPEGCCKNQPEAGGMGWIECCKEKPVRCKGDKVKNLFPDVQRCLIEEHEQSHIGDVPQDYCKCKPDGHLPPGGAPTECKAFKRELTCLLTTVDCTKCDKRQRQACKYSKETRRLFICEQLLTSKCDQNCTRLMKYGKWVGD